MRYVAVARAVWGASLLLAPGVVARLASGKSADRATTVTGPILGVRHLAQALAVEREGTRTLLLAGAAVDAAHALSVIGLAALSKDHRRSAALDAALAAVLVINGLRETRNV